MNKMRFQLNKAISGKHFPSAMLGVAAPFVVSGVGSVVIAILLAVATISSAAAQKAEKAQTNPAASRAVTARSLASKPVTALAAKPATSRTTTTNSATHSTHSTSSSNQNLTPDEITNIRVYKTCNRAVVNITTVTESEDMFFNVTPQEGVGSGTIISTDGLILTNYHVIKGVNRVKVTLFDGTVYGAQLIGDDPPNDIAIIKINSGAKKLSTLGYGDSSNLEVGRRVFAIGNPFGFGRTMTAGIISSLDRTIKAQNGRIIKGVIQTDAAINPGNSGGPLIDASGKIIGITTAIFSPVRTQGLGQSSGIGLAIPINTTKRIIPELIAHHAVSRPEIGIQLVAVTEKGLRIVKLDPRGPAAKAGIQGPKLVVYRDGAFEYEAVDQSLADVITDVDNIPVRSVDDLMSYIEQKKSGQVVTLNVLRSGRPLKIPVKLTVVSPA